jgi:hypothetical protein
MDADMKAWLEISAMRDKIMATRREIMDASHKEIVAESKPEMDVDACQDAMEANLEKLETDPREKGDIVEQQKIPNEEVAIHSLRACRNERTACQEAMEADEEKTPTSVDMKPEVAQKEEVPVQDATMMPVGEPEEEMTPITQKRQWPAEK